MAQWHHDARDLAQNSGNGLSIKFVWFAKLFQNPASWSLQISKRWSNSEINSGQTSFLVISVYDDRRRETTYWNNLQVLRLTIDTKSCVPKWIKTFAKYLSLKRENTGFTRTSLTDLTTHPCTDIALTRSCSHEKITVRAWYISHCPTARDKNCWPCEWVSTRSYSKLYVFVFLRN